MTILLKINLDLMFFCSYLYFMKSKQQHKILVGNKAMRHYGSSIDTGWTEYLTYDESGISSFESETGTIINNAIHSTYHEAIWDAEQDNEIASPSSLLKLECYSFIISIQSCNFESADIHEFNIKFLVRKFGVTNITNLQYYCTLNQYNQVRKIIQIVTKK